MRIKHIYYIITIAISLLLLSCMVEYINHAKFIVINESSHKIRLVSEFSECWRNSKIDIALMPFESSESKWLGGEVVFIWDYLGETVHATFDDEVEFTYNYRINIEHNICNDYCWRAKSAGKHKQKWTFVFTDEDYDRAVAANTETTEL